MAHGYRTIRLVPFPGNRLLVLINSIPLLEARAGSAIDNIETIAAIPPFVDRF